MARPKSSPTPKGSRAPAYLGFPKASQQRAVEVIRETGRERGLHPATCDIDYNSDQLEFMKAVQAFMDRTGIRFPSLSHLHGILLELGYRKTL